jgi:hypothetical protein
LELLRGTDPGDALEDDSVGEYIEVAGYPTPSPTPPAALLAYSIQSIQEPAQKQEHKHSSNSKNCMPWRAAFNAGRLSTPIGRFQGKCVDRAQFQRLREQGRLIELKATQLSQPPKSHHDLKIHLFGALFEQAELAHLESHKGTNSWTEISRKDPRIYRKQVINYM